MSIRYRLRPLDDGITQAYGRLFSGPEEKPPALLRWRFATNPQGAGCFATAEDSERDGAVAGMIALIATSLTVGGRNCRGYQAVDTVVDPDYRGRGLFVGLGNAAHADLPGYGGRILWGFPNANAAPGWFGRLGWSNFGQVPFLVRPLRTGYVLRRFSAVLGRIDIPLTIGRIRPSPSHRPIGRFDSGVDRLWNEFAGATGCAVVRDSAYLNWRLFERPGSEYRAAGCFDDDGGLRAMVATTVAHKHGGSIAYVMEALAARRDTTRLARLIRAQLRDAAADGAEVALAWCPPDAPNRAAYAKAGFLPFPPKLRPIEIHFGARLLDPTAPAAAGEGGAWYLSYLDSDTV